MARGSAANAVNTVGCKPKKKTVVAPKKKKTVRVTWKDQLEQWKRGNGLPDIKSSTSSIFFETSRAHSGGMCAFEQKVTSASKHLSMRMKADSSHFSEHLSGKTSPVQFYNLDQTAILVSPPDNGKNFAHLALFYKNSNQRQREQLWKKVAQSVEKVLRRGEDAYVSTHGTNVPWLHVRIEGNPKYYVSKKLKNT